MGISQGEVAKSIPNGEVAEQNKPAAHHLTDFDPLRACFVENCRFARQRAENGLVGSSRTHRRRPPDTVAWVFAG